MEQIVAWLQQQSDLFLFTQTGFWVFLGIVLLFNSFTSQNRITRSAFLLASSLFFYYKTGGYFFSLLIFSTLVDYTIGRLIGISRTKWKRKALLSISVLINLSVLGYFKYTYFLADLLQQMLDQPVNVIDYLALAFNNATGSQVDITTIALPVGISFFTFQTISYSVDVYRRELDPVKNLIDFGFYVSFFPQLIAGPIVRARHFIPQIYKRYLVSNKWLWMAIWLIIAGLFKKMVISDYLAVNLIDRVFEHPMAYSGVEILLAVYAYALQIYCDFSGYTDIALGVGLLLGFHLPINFNHPYKATSIQDFWRRWHISLSKWLRDYLYIPLGGSRKGLFRTTINLLITMVLGGLWHGAALKFIVWGSLHGIALVLNRWIAQWVKFSNGFTRAFGWFITFHFVVITWIVFRIDSLENGQLLINRLLLFFDLQQGFQVALAQPYLMTLLLVGYIIHFAPTRWHRRTKLNFILLPFWLKVLLSAIAVFLIIKFHQSDIQPFIYFRF